MSVQKYLVRYHTKPAPGLTFYEGVLEVFAEDSAQAKERAARELIRTVFMEYYASLFVFDSVEVEA